MTDRAEMEAALESVLFVSSEPVPRAKLLALFDEDERALVEEALAAVLTRYAGDGRGIMVEEVAGGVRLATRPEMGSWLRRFFDVSSGNKLSMAALETLAIVAYRQPITGPEIQELRSVSPAGVLKTLLEKRLVRITGRKEVVGKPFLYGTTREFLVHFGLNSLRDLPPLEEFEETFGPASGAAAPGVSLAGVTAGLLEDAVPAGAGSAAAAAAGSPDAPHVPHALDTAPQPLPSGSGAAELVFQRDDEDREERILREAAAIEDAGGPGAKPAVGLEEAELVEGTDAAHGVDEANGVDEAEGSELADRDHERRGWR